MIIFGGGKLTKKRGDSDEHKEQRLEALAGIMQGFELKLENCIPYP